MRNARKIPRPTISVQSSRTQLALLLCGCTTDKLGEFKAEDLARQYRVPLREAAHMLSIERRRRGLCAL